MNFFLDTEVSDTFKNSIGAVQFGSSNLRNAGEQIAANGTRKFCLPLCLTPLFQSSKLIPQFSRDSIRLKITLENAATGLISPAANAIQNSEIVISDVQMCCYNVELSDEAQSMVMASNQGRFGIVVDDFRHSQLTLPANVTSLNGVVGLSFSSLNRVIILHRPQAPIIASNLSSLGNRGTANLTEISITLNGQQYPQRPIKEGGAAPHGTEVLSEALIADRSNGIFSHLSSIDIDNFAVANPTGADNTRLQGQ